MKFTQKCEFNANRWYFGWSSLDFIDANENRVCVELSDDQIVRLSKDINEKAQKILEKQLQEHEQEDEL